MHANRNMLHGLGLYPTDKCYDPQRPSWLPNWLSSYSEEDCVINGWFGKLAPFPGVTYETLPMPPAPVPVSTPPAAIVAGANATPGQVTAIQDGIIQNQTAAYQSQMSKFFSDLSAKISASTEGCSWYQNKKADGTCATGSTMLWVVAGGAVAAALYFRNR